MVCARLFLRAARVNSAIYRYLLKAPVRVLNKVPHLKNDGICVWSRPALSAPEASKSRGSSQAPNHLAGIRHPWPGCSGGRWDFPPQHLSASLTSLGASGCARSSSVAGMTLEEEASWEDTEAALTAFRISTLQFTIMLIIAWHAYT